MYDRAFLLNNILQSKNGTIFVGFVIRFEVALAQKLFCHPWKNVAAFHLWIYMQNILHLCKCLKHVWRAAICYTSATYIWCFAQPQTTDHKVGTTSVLLCRFMTDTCTKCPRHRCDHACMHSTHWLIDINFNYVIKNEGREDLNVG